MRTGRAHAGILDHVKVDYYGTPTPISQVANVTLIDARTISVQPWEKKMVRRDREGDPRIRPRSEPGHPGRPDPRADAAADRRAPQGNDQARQATRPRDAKIAVRNIRRDANEHLKKLLKDKAIAEDDERRAQDDVQKLTDRFIADIDKLVADKEKEVLTV